MRGYPKGGMRPPLCRRGGGIHKGGTPSKGSLPCAAFWSLFVRTKSDPGCGAGEAPRKRTRGRSPRKPPNRMAAIRKRDVSPPPARRHANLSPSVPCAGTDPSKKIEARRQAGLQDHHAMSFSISSSREPNRSRASWTGLGLDMSTPAPLSRSTGSLEQPPERN